MPRICRIPPDRHRCDAISKDHWHTPSDRCQHTARVKFDNGRKFCRLHGGIAALSVGIATGDIVELEGGE